MTDTSIFTADDWDVLADAPLAAATVVALADQGGGRSEAAAMIEAWRQGGQLFPTSPLITALVRDYDPETRKPGPNSARRRPRNLAPEQAIRVEAAELCHEALHILRVKADAEDGRVYKEFVVHIATAVAQAATTGGVFGLGGARISMAEQAALRFVRMAIDYAPEGLEL